ncbi:MAG: hypothetical protein U9O86_05400 [Campylobacterota bacterium]|nr:hypothetical protein [Campylobacterota bacterium]
MLKLFLNTTDNFLCYSIKKTFTKTENRYKKANLQIDLSKELKKFQDKPLGCVIGIDSTFETKIKLKIKFILGLFFVVVPLVIFSLFSYLAGISVTYGVVATLGVAWLVASRFDELSKRYVQTRMLEFQH